MPRKEKKYHYIYRTTCVVTGKFYVGMHSTDNLQDGYLGSGKILGYSRCKHGDESHRLEILEMCGSRGELRQREREIVNEELLADPLNMNLKYGGEGGWTAQASRCGGSKSGAKNGVKHRELMSDPKYAKMVSTRIKDGLSASSKWNSVKTEKQQRMTAVANSETAMEKRKATFAKNKHMQGENNSQFGTCWLSTGDLTVKVKAHRLDEYLALGFTRGRKKKTSV